MIGKIEEGAGDDSNDDSDSKDSAEEDKKEESSSKDDNASEKSGSGEKIEVKVPQLPESVSDATIATWHVKAGDAVKRDQNLVDIETDKVVLEVVAPADGVLAEITQDEGATVGADDVIGIVEAGAAASGSSDDKSSANLKTAEQKDEGDSEVAGPAGASFVRLSMV